MTPGSVARQAPLSMGFSRQEYWSGLPFPPPGDLPHPGIEPASFMSPAWVPLAPPGKPHSDGLEMLLKGAPGGHEAFPVLLCTF